MLSIENAHNMFSQNNFAELAKQTLAEMWNYAKKRLFCDVILISAEDKKKIFAHRAILSARNEYFQSMFCSNFREADEKEVTISEVPGDILESLVSYCYTGTIEINEDNAELILPHASMLLLPEIVEACSAFFISSINIANCLSMARYAKLYNCKSLLESAEEHMKVSFVNVAATDEFLELSQNEVKEYLSSDELNIDNEKDIFEALMRWIDYDSETRYCALPELFHAIRFCHIDDKYILEYVVNSEQKRNVSLLLNGLKQNKSNVHMPIRKGPKPNRIIVVSYNNIQIYNPKSNVVEINYSIPFRKEFEPALVGEKVILVGINKKVQCFDLVSKTWQELASTLKSRWLSSAATLNDQVYVLGGFYNKSVERWDSNLNQWKKVASMNHRRCHHCTAVLNGKLYAIGGLTICTILNSVECYDPSADTWTECAPMLTTRSNAKAVVANGNIFVFGGWNWNGMMKSIEKYNPETDTWTKVSDMSCCRQQMGAYFFQNKIYLFGGLENNLWLKSIEEFDPATNECKLMDRPNIKHVAYPFCFPYLFKIE